jgi:hypothetical protein
MIFAGTTVKLSEAEVVPRGLKSPFQRVAAFYPYEDGSVTLENVDADRFIGAESRQPQRDAIRKTTYVIISRFMLRVIVKVVIRFRAGPGRDWFRRAGLSSAEARTSSRPQPPAAEGYFSQATF